MSYEKKKLFAYQNKHSHTVHLALGEDYIKVASINNDCAPEQPLIAAELVKRWNAYPELVAKLRNLVDTIECQAESNFLNEDADDGETNDLTEARILLQTLKA